MNHKKRGSARSAHDRLALHTRSEPGRSPKIHSMIIREARCQRMDLVQNLWEGKSSWGLDSLPVALFII